MSPPEPSSEHSAPDVPLGALVHDLSVQIPELVRSELRLAQSELAQKGKRAGIGAGLFGAAGLLAFFGAATLIATVVLALALVLPGWSAALVMAVALFAAAGVAALQGRSKVAEATPAKPERAVAGIKEDIETVKGRRA